MNKIITLISLVVLIGCKTNSRPVRVYYEKYEEISERQKKYVDFYLNQLSEEYDIEPLLKPEGKILLLHGESFRNTYAIMNDRDTVDFRDVEEGKCIALKFYFVPKGEKKVKVRRGDVNNNEIKVKMIDSYNYIEISGTTEEWGVTYLDYLSIISCR